MTVTCHVKDTRFSQLFGHIDTRKKNVYGLHIISGGMHASAIYLHSGKNCHFLHAQITSVQGLDKHVANSMSITIYLVKTSWHQEQGQLLLLYE